MRQMRHWLALWAFVVVAAGAAAWADDDKEEKVALDKLPKAVLKAVKAKFKSAELVSAATEKDNGKLVYEIVIKDKGQNVDVSVTPEGKIVSYERTIDVRDLPRQVKDAIKSKYPRAKMERAEELHKKDKVSFEVVIATGDKKMEVVLDREGKILNSPKADEEGKKTDK